MLGLLIVLFSLQLCRHNEVESRAIDAIFVEKQKAEIELNRLETSMEQERQFTDTLVESMVSNCIPYGSFTFLWPWILSHVNVIMCHLLFL